MVAVKLTMIKSSGSEFINNFSTVFMSYYLQQITLKVKISSYVRQPWNKEQDQNICFCFLYSTQKKKTTK